MFLLQHIVADKSCIGSNKKDVHFKYTCNNNINMCLDNKNSKLSSKRYFFFIVDFFDVNPKVKALKTSIVNFYKLTELNYV